MESVQRTTVVGFVLATCLISAGSAETRKELRFTVGPHANVSVDSRYGAISVKPGSTNQVLVIATLKSAKAEVDSLQKGNRIDVGSHLLSGADQQTGRVDYELSVPPDATVYLRSSTGPLSADGLQGDLTLEGADASVDVRNVSNGHLHIKTMGGPVTVTNVHNGHVEIASISGNVRLNSVTGPLVQVSCNSGKISYDGDFGSGGDYTFTTHTGDIDALVPADASADFSAHSMQGQVLKEFPLQPKQHNRFPVEAGRSFFGTVGKAASEVVMRSFSGKIRLKQR